MSLAKMTLHRPKAPWVGRSLVVVCDTFWLKLVLHIKPTSELVGLDQIFLANLMGQRFWVPRSLTCEIHVQGSIPKEHFLVSKRSKKMKRKCQTAEKKSW